MKDKVRQELKKDLRKLVDKYSGKCSRVVGLDVHLEGLYREIREEDRIQALPLQGLLKQIREDTRLSRDVDKKYEREDDDVTLIDFDKIANYVDLLVSKVNGESEDNKALLPNVRRGLERLRSAYEALMEKEFISPYSHASYSYYSRAYLLESRVAGSFVETFEPFIRKFSQARSKLLKTLELVVGN